ncbi:hypothetical protein DFO70_104322 [Cytobacillus firmus]|uniref:Uncharacterized protein n=2 Tax=Cytobacillus TaxID=2675230 RepID=A0A366JZ42_CYTFI|nr:hypothetical protein DFO70_104322 [Cytobacillus firmus]TDX43425.1 hypothetical protein DFO72_105323 [Cytobacillus oceanisediminis]
MKAYLEKWRRLAHPRQAQDEPHGKAFFAFMGGLACDLEGVGAGARQISTLKILYFFLKKECRIMVIQHST